MIKTAKQVQYDRDKQKQVSYSRMERQYNFLKQKKYAEIDDLLNKKMFRRFKRREKNYDIQTKKLVKQAEAKLQGKKIAVTVKPTTQTLSAVKKEAFAIFQLYIRISKSNNKGFVTLLDNKNTVYYTECDAGHFYPKSNYPQLAFTVDNVFPISKYTNKAQGDNVGIRRKDSILQQLGEYRYNKLESLATDAEAKAKIRKKDYYIEQIKEYAPKAIKEFQSRKLEIPRMLHKYLSTKM